VVLEGGEGLPSSRSLISSLATGRSRDVRISSMSATALYSCVEADSEAAVGDEISLTIYV